MDRVDVLSDSRCYFQVGFEKHVESLKIEEVNHGKVSEICAFKSAPEVRGLSKGPITLEDGVLYTHPRDETPAGIEFALPESEIKQLTSRGECECHMARDDLWAGGGKGLDLSPLAKGG